MLSSAKGGRCEDRALHRVRLAGEGASVAVVDIAAAAAAVEEIESAGDCARFVRLDVTREAGRGCQRRTLGGVDAWPWRHQARSHGDVPAHDPAERSLHGSLQANQSRIFGRRLVIGIVIVKDDFRVRLVRPDRTTRFGLQAGVQGVVDCGAVQLLRHGSRIPDPIVWFANTLEYLCGRGFQEPRLAR